MYLNKKHFVQSVLAQGEGFEPSMPCGIPVFETSTFDHSDTPAYKYIKLYFAECSNVPFVHSTSNTTHYTIVVAKFQANNCKVQKVVL